MKPSSAKAKGRRHQQKIRDDLLKTFAHLNEDDIRSTSMGASGEDILLSPRAQEDVPLSIEAKNCERLNIWGAIEQCAKNCPSTRQPCIVFTRNRDPTYATIPWDFFLELLKCRKYGSDTSTDLSTRLGNAVSAIVEAQAAIRPSSEQE